MMKLNYNWKDGYDNWLRINIYIIVSRKLKECII